jgi:outer membrane protein OmpA-like peptidoglycan-associated protein
MKLGLISALSGVSAALLLAAGVCLAEPGEDHRLLNRYPGEVIKHYDSVEYEEMNMLLSPPVEQSNRTWSAEVEPVAGAITYIHYEIPKGTSALQVFRNYQKAVKRQGMEMVLECDRPCPKTGLGKLDDLIGNHRDLYLNGHSQNQALVAKLANVYVMLFVNEISGRSNVFQFVVEQQALDDNKISPIAMALAKDGKIDVYGFYFDTGKAELKPESVDQLEEVGQILLDHPKLQLAIVGHTDSVGDESANMDLSMRRAVSVKNSLVDDFDIAQARLEANGKGEAEPVASNKTKEGRKQNRRVELIALNPEVLESYVVGN